MKKTLLVSAAFGVLLSSSVLIAADNESPHWEYTGDIGPAHWGELSKDWSTCSTGQSQSPIDIKFSGAMQGDGIMLDYKPSSITVVNNGHTIQQNVDAGSTMQSGGSTYDLVQFHFHSPSEHTFNGKHFPLEVHLVHSDKEGNLAVVGVMLEEGDANETLEKVWQVMPEKADMTTTSNQSLNAHDLLPENTDFALYSGSLTTPPCSEGVRWHVVQQPLELSTMQLKKFQDVISPNNRPILPLNGRMVKTVAD
jgi:carbonic anhydrase